jgi:hypothetical protein
MSIGHILDERMIHGILWRLAKLYYLNQRRRFIFYTNFKRMEGVPLEECEQMQYQKEARWINGS